MSKKTTLIIVLVLLLALIGGIVEGIFFFTRNSGGEKAKKVTAYTITLDDHYCNIKDSKRILKIKITLETISEKTLKKLTEKQFLVRDEVNKIITSLTDEELRGKEGQINLQDKIITKLVELFDDESIINVYFNDYIIQ